VLLQDSARVRDRIAIPRGCVMDMQRQIHDAEGELPHLRIGAAEIAGAHILSNNSLGIFSPV